jgi:hypothetical protein
MLLLRRKRKRNKKRRHQRNKYTHIFRINPLPCVRRFNLLIYIFMFTDFSCANENNLVNGLKRRKQEFMEMTQHNLFVLLYSYQIHCPPCACLIYRGALIWLRKPGFFEFFWGLSANGFVLLLPKEKKRDTDFGFSSKSRRRLCHNSVAQKYFPVLLFFAMDIKSLLKKIYHTTL